MKTTKRAITKDEAIKEAYRYLLNAKQTISNSPIEYGIYQDTKYVREAAGIAYLTALKAIDGYLIGKGIPADELPDSIEEYRRLVKKKIPLNGILVGALTIVYENLHLFAYYREGRSVNMVKEGFEKHLVKKCGEAIFAVLKKRVLLFTMHSFRSGQSSLVI